MHASCLLIMLLFSVQGMKGKTWVATTRLSVCIGFLAFDDNDEAVGCCGPSLCSLISSWSMMRPVRAAEFDNLLPS
jgi:hypothetical protein